MYRVSLAIFYCPPDLIPDVSSYLLRRAPVDDELAFRATFVTSSSKVTVGRPHSQYLCPLAEIPVGSPRRGRRIRRIAWGIRSPGVDTHTNLLRRRTQTFRRLNAVILIVGDIIGEGDVGISQNVVAENFVEESRCSPRPEGARRQVGAKELAWYDWPGVEISTAD